MVVPRAFFNDDINHNNKKDRIHTTTVQSSKILNTTVFQHIQHVQYARFCTAHPSRGNGGGELYQNFITGIFATNYNIGSSNDGHVRGTCVV